MGDEWHTAGIRPRNPRIPIARFDIQTAFRARLNIFKSGISGSGWDVFVFLDAMIFCNKFAR